MVDWDFPKTVDEAVERLIVGKYQKTLPWQYAF
jgi:hypothetical protein